jgi:outer membrane receptor for ferrienterochelin and colicin
MKHFKLFLFVIFLYTALTDLHAQIVINGLVRTSDTNEPVPFAIIKVVHLNKLIPGNESGAFKVSVPSLPVKIQVSSIGYSMTTVNIVSTDSQIIVILQPSALNLNEVNVYASKGGIQASNLQSLKNVESYKLAGTTKDIFRSIQMLPGVSSNNAASANYNVRGGTFDENLMLINGIEVAEPYHIKVFPMASIGIFNIDLVQRIDFSAGGFSAEYGDALSSVLNVDYKRANNDSLTGRINLGMIDLGAHAEIPINKKTSLLIGARHSYLDPVIKMMETNEKISIGYYDIQARLDFQPSQRHLISFFGIYSHDKDMVGPQTKTTTENVQWRMSSRYLTVPRSWKNYFLLDSKYEDILLAVTTRHTITNGLQLNTELSYYYENENNPQINSDSLDYLFNIPGLFNKFEYSRDDIRKYKIKIGEGKVNLKILINPSNKLKVGGYIRNSSFDFNRQLSTSWHYYENTTHFPNILDSVVIPSDPGLNTVQLFKTNAVKWGAYATHTIQMNGKLVVDIGIRMDYFQLNKTTDISPRLSALYTLTPELKVNMAWGLFYKSPVMKQIKYSYSTSANTKSQQAIHYLIGLERKYDTKTVKIEAYYKKYNDLIPLRRTANGEIIYDNKENCNEGYAKGIDLEYIVSKKHYDFWLNYSLGEAKERQKGTSDYYSRYTDQTHTLSTFLSLKLSKRRELDIKLTYGSGYAYQLKFLDQLNKRWITGEKITTGHLPYYASLDLRYTKYFRLKYGTLQLFADIMNVLDRKNILGHQYSFDSMGSPWEEDYKFLGILPTIGIMYDF